MIASSSVLESLHQSGYAVLDSHPVSKHLILDSYQEWKRFFASDSKFGFFPRKNCRSGYFEFQSEGVLGSQTMDPKEYYQHYPRNFLPDAIRHTKKLLVDLEALGLALLDQVQTELHEYLTMDLDESLSELSSQSQENLFRAHHYPGWDGELRVGPHRDMFFLTISPTATEEGLEFQELSGNWKAVRSTPESIVINVGQFLSEATGGYLPAPLHRVTGGALSSRYTQHLFLSPKRDFQLSKRHRVTSFVTSQLKQEDLPKGDESE